MGGRTSERHLDLGCGSRPRNPYGRAELHGVDIAGTAGNPFLRQANLALGPIPFPDAHFASVSAYDFLEHVPRVLATADGSSTRLPFVELMDEVWRVLEPGGLFYAQTPAYPASEAFMDPTHVNIITFDTHTYFARPWLSARPYGFRGQFDVVRVVRFKPVRDYELAGMSKLSRLRQWFRRPWGQGSHVLWELRAVK